MVKNNKIFNIRMGDFYRKLNRRKEKWKRVYIDDQPTKFYISNLGRIHNIKKNTITDCEYDRCKYINIELKDGDLKIKTSLHRLVATYFNKIPKRHKEKGLTFDDLVVNHINGIPSCDAAFNLEWCTQYENMMHAFVTGLCTDIYGEKSHLSKTTNETIEKVCKMMEDGMTNKEIMRQIEISESTLKHIRSDEAWKQISKKYDFPKLSTTIPYSHDDKEIHEVCKLLEQHKYSDAEISKITGMDRRYITDIRLGERRTDISSLYNIDKKPVEKITENMIENVCKLLEDGELSQRKIAKEVEVSQWLVSEIYNRKKYTEISNKYNFNK